MLLKILGGAGLPVAVFHVCHKHGVTAGALYAQSCSEPDAGVRRKYRVDLAEFDAESTHLDLEV
ncbi:hypothetical protein GCM10011410_13350 [Hoyosella rhizosphaerae]|uniref:Uncharacterized protein n=1 Tax=Hoyosella rhizosphaerae TaxID=1755582 RepID=A0A916XDB2_9ACTN|nr:hypothetical protein GCM10011410_13350 [Hoyosella rhizosphaerae]